MVDPDSKDLATLSPEQRRALIEKALALSPEEQQGLLEQELERVGHLTPEQQRAIVANGQKMLNGMTPEEQQAFMKNWQQTVDTLSPQQQEQLNGLLRQAQEAPEKAVANLATGAEKTTGSVVASTGDKPLENDKASKYKNNDRAKVEQAQKDMAALGIDCGPSDGKFGPLTEKGVKAFEERMKKDHPEVELDGKLSKKELELLHKEAEKARAQGKGKEEGKDHGPQSDGKDKPQGPQPRPKHLDGAENITMDEAKIAMTAAGMNFDDMTNLSRDLAGPTGLNRKVDVNTKIMAYLDDLGTKGETITVNGAEMTAAEARKAVGLAGSSEATTALAGSVITGIAAEMGVALAQAREQGVGGQHYASADVSGAGRPMSGGDWRPPELGGRA